MGLFHTTLVKARSLLHATFAPPVFLQTWPFHCQRAISTIFQATFAFALRSQSAKYVWIEAFCLKISRIVTQVANLHSQFDSQLIQVVSLGPEGMEKFCEDIGVDPENVVMLVIAYKMGAKQMGFFTQEEWIKGTFMNQVFTGL